MRIKVKNSGIIRLESHRNQLYGNLFVAEIGKRRTLNTFDKKHIVKLKAVKPLANGMAEEMRHIPFKIKRVYFINNFKHPERARGEHAHKKLHQVIICLHGSFVLNLDDGKNKQRLKMNDPSVGVVLGSMLWHTIINFSKDCVILVLADDWYKKSDYLRSYREFRAYAQKNG